MHRSIEAVRSLLDTRPQVRLAYIFGSLASGNESPSSDLDVGILFAANPSPEALDRLSVELEAVSDRKVDIVDLRRAPPLRIHEIVITGRLLVCRNEDERVGFITQSAARFLDTAHLRKVQYSYLRQRTEAYRAASG